ncbi:MAG: hypothetical protein JWO33_2688 [Caulobacteraceae bacterium]|nr:hypothetical protein [Caulobacteraceae bacterium]
MADPSASSDRLACLRAGMERAGLSAFVGLASGAHNFLDINPVQSLTGFKNMGEAALLIRRGAPDQLLVSPAWDAARARGQTQGLVVTGVDDLAAALQGVLGARPTGKVGVAGATRMRVDVAQLFLGCGAKAMVDADALVAQAAIAAAAASLRPELARGVAVAEQTYAYFLETAEVGMRECDLAAEVYARSRELGADDNFMLIRASQHNEGITVAGQRRIEAGDIIVCEITPSVGGQFVQLPRTAVVGPPTALMQERFDLLMASVRAGIAATRPGVKANQINAAMDAVIAEAGFGDYCRPPYMRVRGHGMGNVSSQPGDLLAGNETPIEAGMTFVIHAEQYLPGPGYMLVGDPVYVAADGAVVIAERPCVLDVVGG